MDYGSILLKIRTALEMTQTEFVEGTGKTQSYIQSLETGRIKVPSIDFIAAVVRKYNVNPFVFVYDSQPVFMKGKPVPLAEETTKLLAIGEKVREIAELLELDSKTNILRQHKKKK